MIHLEGIVSTYEDGSVIPVEFVFNKKVPFMADSIEYDMYKCFEHKNSIWNTILNNHIQQNQESPKLLFVSHDPPYNTSTRVKKINIIKELDFLIWEHYSCVTRYAILSPRHTSPSLSTDDYVYM